MWCGDKGRAATGTDAGAGTPLLAALLLCLALLSVPSHAEFYTWIDGEGRKRVSNVPPPGVRDDGTVVEDHHPWSAAAQHRRLRDRLRRQADRLMQKAATGSGGPVPNVPSEVLNGD